MIGRFSGDLPADPGGGDTAGSTIDLGGGTIITAGREGTGFIPGEGGGGTLAFGGEGRISQKEYPIPPGVCILARVQMSTAEGGAFQGSEATDEAAALAALAFLKRRTIQTALDQWRRDFPQAPPAFVQVGRSSSLAPFNVFVVRPHTAYDPVLDSLGAPVIPNGTPIDDPASARFNAALRVFFPDFVLDPTTGAQLTGGRTGSETIYGPFPRNVPFVSSDMVALAVQVAHMPGAFQPGAGDSGPSFFDAVGAGAKTGLTALAATRNIYAAAGAAAARFIVGVFDWLFGSGPQPPAWLTALLHMKTLREGGGSPSFFGVATGGAGLACTKATITPHGTMTIEQGYDAFIRQLHGGAGNLRLWLIVGAAVAGAYLLTE